jgi:hypothetical protein
MRLTYLYAGPVSTGAPSVVQVHCRKRGGRMGARGGEGPRPVAVLATGDRERTAAKPACQPVNDPTRGPGHGAADTCALMAMVNFNFLKSCRPSRPDRPVRPGSQGAGITLVHPLSVAVPQLVSSAGHSIQSGTVLPGLT